MPDEPSYIDEHHERFVTFANDYLDDDDERAEFVDSMMERHGYERISGWGPPADPDGKGTKKPLVRKPGPGGPGRGGRTGFRPRGS